MKDFKRALIGNIYTWTYAITKNRKQEQVLSKATNRIK